MKNTFTKILVLAFAVFASVQLYATAVEKTVGTGTSASDRTPYNIADGAGVCQALYTASEINATGIIRSISFYVDVANPSAITHASRKVFVALTDKTSFSSASDYIPESSLTEVNEGWVNSSYYNIELGKSTGWETINFETPILFDGTKNIVIVVKSEYLGTSSGITYRYTTNSGKCLRKSDGDSQISGETNAYMTSTWRPNIKFTISTPDLVDGYYIINDKYELQWFRDEVNNGENTINGKLGNESIYNHYYDDLDWTPIGTSTYPYNGTFDGNSKSIYIKASSGTALGLFGYIGSSGVVKDLQVSANLTGTAPIGALVASNAGTITNCRSYGKTITATGSSGTGGLCGVNSGTIENCENNNAVTSASFNVGGICGKLTGGTVSNCWNSSTTNYIQGTDRVGGICGAVLGSATITNSYNKMAVENTSAATNDYGVGGIVGYASTSLSVLNCYNQGTVHGANHSVGGIVGYGTTVTITDCYNSGTITSDSYYVGSLSGRPATITNSFYLQGSATDGNSVMQNAVGASTLGSITDDAAVYGKAGIQFTNGEVCYLLNHSVSAGSPWGHSIGDYPVLNSTQKVYYYEEFDAYSNKDIVPQSVVATMSAVEGDGSEESPYLISNYNELVAFQQLINYGFVYKCGKLVADIVANESILGSDGMLRNDFKTANLNVWKPIGAFSGIFDGNNHSIQGLYIYSSTEGQAFVANAGSESVIKNLTLTDCFVKGGSNTAALCVQTKGTISNCHVTARVEAPQAFAQVGGLVALAENATISECSFSGSIEASDTWYVAGIVGLAKNTTISSCYNTASVMGSIGVAGVVGRAESHTLIDRCYNTGQISRFDTMNMATLGVGGICGAEASYSDAMQYSSITNCFNTGNISGLNAGGVCGSVGGIVQNCYSAGSVFGTGNKGAIAGTTDGSYYTISYCYYDSDKCSVKGINNIDVSNSAYPHTTAVLCNENLSTALRDTYSPINWNAGTTANASSEIITKDGVLGYKIIGTYPSLVGVGEAQHAITLYANVGTADNPNWITNFTPIYTIEQLKAVKDNLTGTYVVMNNLYESKNLSNGVLKASPTVEWEPIGVIGNDLTFRGKFYGRGFTISGIYMNGDYKRAGLFGVIEGSALVTGVKTANGSITSTNASSYVGGIVGAMTRSYVDGELLDPIVTECTNGNNVKGYNAGGVCGSACGNLMYCSNTDRVEALNDGGGIAGESTAATIKYCTNYGSVSSDEIAGGIVGVGEAIYDCYNLGTVTGQIASGIIGGGAFGVNVKRSYNASHIGGVSSAGNIVGAAGLGVGTTKDCYYARELNEYSGIFETMDEVGMSEGISLDELCLTLPQNYSSDVWAIKEPVVQDGKKYLYYPYLKYFGEESAKVGTYRAISKVTLNPNGGTCTDLTEYIEREGAELPQDVVREGYTFGGWYSNASCTSDEVTEIPVTATGEQTFYAKWNANSYSITLNTNGGTINSGNVTTYTYGNSVMLPADISQIGYTFGGWYTSSSFAGSSVQSVPSTATGNKTYYAKWTVNKYTVTFVTNNGTINDGNVTQYTYGEGATLPTNVTKTGHTFAGWYTNDSYAGERMTSISTTTTGDKTFYAKWNVNSYDVTLNTDSGTINSGNIASYIYGVGATLPTDISKTGYTFGGWYDNSSCSGSPVLSIASNAIDDKEFWAKWDTINYTITYNANEGVFATTPAESYKYGDEVTLPVPTREGYTFAGWYNNSNLVGTEFTQVESTETGNKEFWAKWDVNTYTVSLDAKGGDINSGNVASYTYNVLTILPQDVTKVGHTFEGWFDSENQKVTQISKGTIGDVTFTAKWTAKTYSVTLQANNGTVNAGNITSYTYGLGATLPEDVTKTGYEFLGWFDNSSYDGGKVTKIADNEIGNKNFWAKWTAASYDVTLDANGGTINSNAIESYTYGVGAVLPTDVTKIGYTFKGWKNEKNEDALEITTADYGNKTFTAQWEKADYSIAYNANGGSINGSYETTYNYGNEITLPTDATKEGNEFLGWYDNPNFTGEAVETISATEYGDKTFYASWKANQYGVTFEANGGTINSGEFAIYTYGVTAILPTDVTKDGYTFTGWYADEACEGDVVSIVSSTDLGAKTFYAGWSNSAYSVTLHTNDGIISSGNVTAYTFGHEEQLPTEEQVSKTGYKFEGWYDNASCVGTSISSIPATATGNKQFWAKWSVNSYAITLNTNGGTINSGNVKNYIYGTTVVLPSDVTKTGHSFDGWYDNDEFAGEAITTIANNETGDKTFYAKFSVNTYNVILVTNEGVINSGNIETYEFGKGATLPTDVTKTGYTFGGWYSNTSYIGGTVSSIADNDMGDKQFWAKWSINEYEVAATAENGTVEGTGSYEYKSTATLKAIANDGYEFVGWNDNELKDERIQLTVTKDTTLTANFKEKEKVQIAGSLDIPTLKTEREAAPIDLTDLFVTTEGSEISYSATSSAPNVVAATVSEGKLFLTVYEYEGEAEITVTATLPNGEKNSVKATATVVLACNIQVEETITNVSCYGESDGEIALKVTNAAEPYTTLWTGDATEDTLRNVTAGNYTVVITDNENCSFTKTYTVTQPEEMSLSAKIKNPTCENADGAVTVTLTGAESAAFAWSNGATTQNAANLAKGDYSLVVTNTETGCQIGDNFTLVEPEAPVVTVSNVVETACNESAGAVTISANEDGLLYNWSNNKHTKNLTNVPAGDYTLSVVNPETNCTATLEVTVPSIKLKQPEIALVTVSEQTGKNLVVWLKENTDLIQRYNIYRESETANVYTKIAEVPYSELSVYEDLEANPAVTAWRYKISATDVCNEETELGEYHKTIHLMQNQGLGGVYNLDWNTYEGLDFPTYVVIRKSVVRKVVTMDTIAYLSSNNNTYTDTLPAKGTQAYYVGMVLPEEINPMTQFMKAESGPFSIALSNIAEVESDGPDVVYDLSGSNAKAYAWGHTIYVKGAAGEDVAVYDVKGRKIDAAEGRDEYEFNVRLDGVYFVKVGEYTFKVVVE